MNAIFFTIFRSSLQLGAKCVSGIAASAHPLATPQLHFHIIPRDTCDVADTCGSVRQYWNPQGEPCALASSIPERYERTTHNSL